MFELDDFSYWVEQGVADDRGDLAFSPLFVFLIDWAWRRNFLDRSFAASPVTQGLYQDLIDRRIGFGQFVLDALDGKMLDDYFSERARQFVRDYVECDGYTKDLSRFYNLNMWELPHTLDCIDKFYSAIDQSFDRYVKNKSENPNIVSFE